MCKIVSGQIQSRHQAAVARVVVVVVAVTCSHLRELSYSGYDHHSSSPAEILFGHWSGMCQPVTF